MKITIDTSTTPHRVEIEGNCTIGELIEFLSKYYGDFTWKDIRISGKSLNIQLPHTQPFTQPLQPWQPTTSPSPFSPGTGGNPWHIGDWPGSTITYCSDNNTITNASTGDVFTLPTSGNLNV